MRLTAMMRRRQQTRWRYAFDTVPYALYQSNVGVPGGIIFLALSWTCTVAAMSQGKMDMFAEQRANS